MRMLLCALALLVAVPAAADPGDAEYQFLWSEGAYLHRVALNGTTVAGDTAISISLPIYVTKYLRDGDNELEVEYTSDTRVGLSVTLETRARGRKDQIVRFSSPYGESNGARVVKKIPFTLQLRRQVPLRLSSADRGAITALLQTYYNTLARKDGAGLVKLYSKAVEQEGEIYPEGIGLFQWVLSDSLRMIANPKFRMKPYQGAALQFSVDGQVVVVTRPDQSPLVESAPMEAASAGAQPAAGAEGAQADPGLKPMSLSFKRYEGRWYLALPFGF